MLICELIYLKFLKSNHKSFDSNSKDYENTYLEGFGSYQNDVINQALRGLQEKQDENYYQEKYGSLDEKESMDMNKDAYKGD